MRRLDCSPLTPYRNPHRHSLNVDDGLDCGSRDDDIGSVVGSSIQPRIDIEEFEKRLEALIDHDFECQVQEREFDVDDDTEILEIFPTASASAEQEPGVSLDQTNSFVESNRREFEQDLKSVLREYSTVSMEQVCPANAQSSNVKTMELSLQTLINQQKEELDARDHIDRVISHNPNSNGDVDDNKMDHLTQRDASRGIILSDHRFHEESDHLDVIHQEGIHYTFSSKQSKRACDFTLNHESSNGDCLAYVCSQTSKAECDSGMSEDSTRSTSSSSLQLREMEEVVPAGSVINDAHKYVTRKQKSSPSATSYLDGTLSHDLECQGSSKMIVDNSLMHLPFLDVMEDFEVKFRGALFGRNQEVAQLRQAFGRICQGSSEIIHVRGSSGAGKTQLITRALQDYVSYQFKGHFVSGKFDQLRMNAPYSAVVKALVDWCNCVINGDRLYLLKISSILCEEDPEDLEILKQLIPPVRLLCGDKERRIDSDGLCDAARPSFLKLKIMCCKLVQALSSCRPTVFYLDDMQWADQPSRSLVQTLCSDMSSKNVLFVLVCRDREYHELRVDLLKNCHQSLDTSAIGLKSLKSESISEMLSSVLGIEPSTADSVANILAQKTNGNIRHAVRYLKYFLEKRVLYMSSDAGAWSWDELKAEKSPSSINELLQQEVMRQNPELLYIGCVAACIGFSFDVRLLISCVQTLSENRIDETTIKQYLITACRKGFMTQVSMNDYDFSHDNVQQSFYEIIESFGGRDGFHLTFGVALCEMIRRTKNASDAMIFLAVDHMNQSSYLITAYEKRRELATLNLMAGKVAIRKAAHVRAAQHFRDGIHLLALDSMWIDDYSLTYDLHKLLAFTSHCTQDFQESDIVVAALQERSATSADAFEAALIMMKSLSARGAYETGVIYTLNMLEIVQYSLNNAPTRAQIMYEAAQTRRIIRQSKGKQIPSAIPADLPFLEAVVKLLSFLALFTFHSEGRRRLFKLAIMKMMQLTYKNGLVSSSANAFLWYGIFQENLRNGDAARRFYSFGCALLKKSGESKVEAPASIFAHIHINYHRKPLIEMDRDLKQTFDASLRFHNTGMSAFAAFGHVCASFFCGDISLNQVEKEARFVVQYMRQSGFGDHLRLTMTILQTSICLQGGQHSWKLFGDCIDGDRATLEALQEGDMPGLDLLIGMRLLLAVSFEKWSLVQTLLNIPVDRRKIFHQDWSTGFNILIRGIACVAQYRQTRKHRYLREGSRLKRVLHKLAERNHYGYQRKILLLDAELASLKAMGSTDSLLKAYHKVIEVPISGDKISLTDSAFANERAAVVLVGRCQMINARRFVVQAIDSYSRWGALAKVKWLESRFCTILCDGRQNSVEGSDTSRNDVFSSDSSSSDHPVVHENKKSTVTEILTSIIPAVN